MEASLWIVEQLFVGDKLACSSHFSAFYFVHCAKCISQNALCKMYFSKYISQNAFLKMYFSKCISQNVFLKISLFALHTPLLSTLCIVQGEDVCALCSVAGQGIMAIKKSDTPGTGVQIDQSTAISLTIRS